MAKAKKTKVYVVSYPDGLTNRAEVGGVFSSLAAADNWVNAQEIQGANVFSAVLDDPNSVECEV